MCNTSKPKVQTHTFIGIDSARPGPTTTPLLAIANMTLGNGIVHAGHYENFPVASILLPAALRRPARAIYRFARTADDIADEGDLTPAERLAGLQALREGLDTIAHGRTPTDALLVELAEAIRTYRLPTQAFHDLLDAFSQDVTCLLYTSPSPRDS